MKLSELSESDRPRRFRPGPATDFNCGRSKPARRHHHARGHCSRVPAKAEPEEMTVAEAGSMDLVVAFPDEPLYAALTKMLERDVGRLPVVERNNPGRVVGYLGRAAILSARMKTHEEENIRQRGSSSGKTIKEPNYS